MLNLAISIRQLATQQAGYAASARTSDNGDISLLVLDFLQALLIRIVSDLHALKPEAAAAVCPHECALAALL